MNLVLRRIEGDWEGGLLKCRPTGIDSLTERTKGLTNSMYCSAATINSDLRDIKSAKHIERAGKQGKPAERLVESRKPKVVEQLKVHERAKTVSCFPAIVCTLISLLVVRYLIRNQV